MHSGFSYAVCWREGDGPVHVGKLQLHSGYLALAGPYELSISLDEIVGVRIGRLVDERIRGLPSLVLEQSSGVPVSIIAPVGLGSVQELARLLSRPRGSEAP